MRLNTEFIRLPRRFDAARLAEEALQFPEADWAYHPLRHTGNAALRLVSANGGENDDYIGHMKPTQALEKCPYITQIMGSFQTVIGRSRLMRLAPGAPVPPHSDGNYSWRNRVRIHIPIITDPRVIFSSIGGIDVHMQAGECWIFDNWRPHSVQNDSDIERIHLVIDTLGSGAFWRFCDTGQDARDMDGVDKTQDCESYAFNPESRPKLRFERFNRPPVAPPDEVAAMLTDFMSELVRFRLEHPAGHTAFEGAAKSFLQDWRCTWAEYGDTPEGNDIYAKLIEDINGTAKIDLGTTKLKTNEANAYEIFASWSLSLLNRDNDRDGERPKIQLSKPPITPPSPSVIPQSPEQPEAAFLQPAFFDRPVFIVAAPRSGSTMLFEALKENKDLWSIGDESHREIEDIAELNPVAKNYASGALDERDFTTEIGHRIMAAFYPKLQSARGASYDNIPLDLRPPKLRFLEKTPKNALRIPFFKTMFPDARFIFLHRKAPQNIASIIDAWMSERFTTYPDLPGWEGPRWSLLLPEGWRAMARKSVAEIAAWQWAQTNSKILNDLNTLPPHSWQSVRYEDLVAHPAETLETLCRFAEIPFGPRMQAFAHTGFPNSKYTMSAPDPEKWKRHEDSIAKALPPDAKIIAKLENLL